MTATSLAASGDEIFNQTSHVCTPFRAPSKCPSSSASPSAQVRAPPALHDWTATRLPHPLPQVRLPRHPLLRQGTHLFALSAAPRHLLRVPQRLTTARNVSTKKKRGVRKALYIPFAEPRHQTRRKRAHLSAPRAQPSTPTHPLPLILQELETQYGISPNHRTAPIVPFQLRTVIASVKRPANHPQPPTPAIAGSVLQTMAAKITPVRLRRTRRRPPPSSAHATDHPMPTKSKTPSSPPRKLPRTPSTPTIIRSKATRCSAIARRRIAAAKCAAGV